MTSEAYHTRKRKKRSSIWNTGWDEEEEEIIVVDCCDELKALLEIVLNNQTTMTDILNAHTATLTEIKACACDNDPPFEPIIPNPGVVKIGFENQGLVSVEYKYILTGGRFIQNHVFVDGNGVFTMDFLWSSAIRIPELHAQFIQYLENNNIPIEFKNLGSSGSQPGTKAEALLAAVDNTRALGYAAPRASGTILDLSRGGSFNWPQSTWTSDRILESFKPI